MGAISGFVEFVINAPWFNILLVIFLSFIGWFVKERIYYIPKIDGKWEMILSYEKSKLNSYIGMEVYYTLFIQQDIGSIKVESEKYAEKQPMKKMLYYAPRGKTLGSYYGNLQRGFMNHPISLNVKEEGLIRNVVGNLNLKVVSSCQMEGTFEKGDASSSGKVFCTKII